MAVARSNLAGRVRRVLQRGFLRRQKWKRERERTRERERGEGLTRDERGMKRWTERMERTNRAGDSVSLSNSDALRTITSEWHGRAEGFSWGGCLSLITNEFIRARVYASSVRMENLHEGGRGCDDRTELADREIRRLRRISTSFCVLSLARSCRVALIPSFIYGYTSLPP